MSKQDTNSISRKKCTKLLKRIHTKTTIYYFFREIENRTRMFVNKISTMYKFYI